MDKQVLLKEELIEDEMQIATRMKRKGLVRVHLIATVLAVLVISTFFITSLVAELGGDPLFIKSVKRRILYFVTLLVFVMQATEDEVGGY